LLKKNAEQYMNEQETEDRQGITDSIGWIISYFCVMFQVLTILTKKMVVLWEMTLWTDRNQRSGDTCYFQLQGRKQENAIRKWKGRRQS
jgi:hypothetical protein